MPTLAVTEKRVGPVLLINIGLVIQQPFLGYILVCSPPNEFKP